MTKIEAYVGVTLVAAILILVGVFYHHYKVPRGALKQVQWSFIEPLDETICNLNR